MSFEAIHMDFVYR